MKQWMSLLLAMVMLVTCIPALANSSEVMPMPL